MSRNSYGSQMQNRRIELSPEFTARYRINGIEERPSGGYLVHSNGKTYEVKNRTRLDECGSMYFQWQCDCPRRETCRHIEAVVQARWDVAAADEDYDGMDIMEREQLD